MCVGRNDGLLHSAEMVAAAYLVLALPVPLAVSSMLDQPMGLVIESGDCSYHSVAGMHQIMHFVRFCGGGAEVPLCGDSHLNLSKNQKFFYLGQKFATMMRAKKQQ